MVSFFPRRRRDTYPNDTYPNDSDYHTDSGSNVDRHENSPWVKIYATMIPPTTRSKDAVPHFLFYREARSQGLTFTGPQNDENPDLMREVNIPENTRSRHIFSLHRSTGEIKLSQSVKQSTAESGASENTPSAEQMQMYMRTAARSEYTGVIIHHRNFFTYAGITKLALKLLRLYIHRRLVKEDALMAAQDPKYRNDSRSKKLMEKAIYLDGKIYKLEKIGRRKNKKPRSSKRKVKVIKLSREVDGQDLEEDVRAWCIVGHVKARADLSFSLAKVV
ncbi:hypothetical protein ACMFMG_009534 [Clarireedia jacksonii]